MIVIPAIDLKDGRCVRLLQGRKEDVTVYSEDPASMARQWERLGAELLHVVDLDGAFTGDQKNFDKISAIRKAIDIPIEVGGGIRDLQRIEKLIALGVDRVIIGTAAAKDPDMVRNASDKFPGKVIVGIDAKNGKVAIKG
ncbi:MAG: HisA/HisF-related TIM barrel protein, partial [Nitrospirota bacterium]